jgi:hypothetical protein
VEAPLSNQARRFEKAIERRLAKAWERRQPPADDPLSSIYKIGLEYLGPEWDDDTKFTEVSVEVTAYVLKAFERAPGVIAIEEGDGTRVFFAKSLEPVVLAIENQIHDLAAEFERVDE